MEKILLNIYGFKFHKKACVHKILFYQEGRAEVVRLLLAKGANITLRDENGNTALDWAREARDSFS